MGELVQFPGVGDLVRQRPSKPLVIENTHQDGAHWVLLSGELDFSNARSIPDHLLALAHYGDVVVDVSGVTFIDADGLAVLVEGRRLVEWEGGRFEVRGAKGLMARLLGVAGSD